MISLTLIAVLLLFALTAFFLLRERRPIEKTIPGPPFLEGLRTFITACKENTLHELATIWAQKYGDIVEVNSVLRNIVFVNDPGLARRLYCDNESKDITNDRPPGWTGKYGVYDYSDIVVANDGPELTKRRKIFHQIVGFYGEGVQAFETLLQETSKRLINNLKQYEGDVPLVKELNDYTCRVVVQLMKGDLLREEDLGIMVKFIDSANAVFQFENETVLQFHSVLRFVPGLKSNQIADLFLRSRDAYHDAFFSKVREAFDEGNRVGIIADLLRHQEKVKAEGHADSLCDNEVKAILQDVAATAYLTSASTITSVLLYLIRDQRVQENVYAEIQKVIGYKQPAFEHRRAMPYTEAVVLESFRLACIAPFHVPHFANKDITIDGRTICKGSVIITNSWYYHHREDHWEDPWSFKPERFLDASGQMLPQDHPQRRKVNAFGSGRRVCPGESFARSRVFLILVTLLQEFRFLPPIDAEMPSANPADWLQATVFAPGEYKCKLESRG